MSESFLKNLVGSKIDSVEFDAAAQSWLLKFHNGDSLNIECMWRLLEESLVASTSEDHGHFFGREKPFDGVAALIEMGTHEIRAVEVNRETGDLAFELGQYFVFQVISTSGAYESWQYVDNSGRRFVAVGGQVHEY